MGEPRRIVNLPGFSGKPPSSLSEQCDVIRRGRRGKKKEGLDCCKNVGFFTVRPVIGVDAYAPRIKTASTKKPNSRERSRGRWFPAVPSGSSTLFDQTEAEASLAGCSVRHPRPLAGPPEVSLFHPAPSHPSGAVCLACLRKPNRDPCQRSWPITSQRSLRTWAQRFHSPIRPRNIQLSAALAHLPGESLCGGVGTSRSGTAFFSPCCLREAKTFGLEARRNPSATSSLRSRTLASLSGDVLAILRTLCHGSAD
ncbi:hypothetical protein CSAL01_03684 [Colletotrichum salicis]|uniref:Uncharacterized protein n=1 Tax=Colletotrichum salicis TaxID=1209931 RepID=A0A135V2W7_9PEZI|nr:hypothetical protein CSAL01_03684 [Colletotrichum salicis]